MELEKYSISSNTGFLPPDPLSPLKSDYFSEWEQLLSSLHTLVREQRVREEVEKLPDRDFSDKTLNTKEEWQRAYVILSFIAQSYIYESANESESSQSPIRLPSKLAIPWHTTAKYIGLPPVAAYAAVVLYNYTLKDPKKPLNADNLESAVSFTGSNEESWFFMIHALEEIAASTGLQSVALAYGAMERKDNKSLATNLKVIAETLQEMKTIFGKMRIHCSAEFFYYVLRPFLGFPDCGVIYEGVSIEVKKYRSGSGAQDSAIPAFDIFLGIKHAESEQETLDDFKLYMPAEHRDFLITLYEQPSVKLYVQQSKDTELIKYYDEAVRALEAFRSEHIQIVTSYIINAKRLHGGTTLNTDMGTGGTPFMQFLKKVKGDTV